jgi:oxygen-independent coproporphyrinogen-3 oxidase
MLAAMKKEIRIRGDFFEGQSVDTVYFGGGTPSMLSGRELKDILTEANYTFEIATKAEITIEVNPEDVNEESATQWLQTGFNRISLGIQSLEDPILKYLNRAHHRSTAINALNLLRKAGFNEISVDLISGVPGLSNDQLQENIHALLEFEPEHFSIYSLTIEPKTLLGHYQKKGLLNIEEDTLAEQYEISQKLLIKQGYLQYEVSNYAKSLSHVSKHNSAYWKMIPYLGIGPSAHSFKGNTRYKNTTNNALYIQQINQHNSAGQEELLSDKDIFNDILITGLRTHWGVKVECLKILLPETAQDSFMNTIENLISSGDIVREEERMRIPSEKFLVSDRILLKLLQ